MKKIFLLIAFIYGTCRGAIILNVMDFGAVGNGTADDTNAIRDAANKCNQIGGCALTFPSGGTFLTGSFNLTSNSALIVQGTILGWPKIDNFHYPLIEAVPSYPAAKHNTNPRYSALIEGSNLENLFITGGGTIDGNGISVYDNYQSQKLTNTRPRLIEILYTNNVKMHQLTIQNAAFWTVLFYSCNQVHLKYLSIYNELDEVPNTDGIDIDSTSNVLITHTNIHTGDDSISLKSGSGVQGRDFATPTTNVTIFNNTINVGAGIAIGSETAGGISNVYISQNSVDLSANLVRIKNCISDGGIVENVTYSNMTSSWVAEAILVNMFYECTLNSSAPVSILRNIYLENLSVYAGRAGELKCAQNSPCNLELSNIDIDSVLGFSDCEYVNGTTHNVYPKLSLPCNKGSSSFMKKKN